jgi:hypothetical protein
MRELARFDAPILRLQETSGGLIVVTAARAVMIDAHGAVRLELARDTGTEGGVLTRTRAGGQLECVDPVSLGVWTIPRWTRTPPSLYAVSPHLRRIAMVDAGELHVVDLPEIGADLDVWLDGATTATLDDSDQVVWPWQGGAVSTPPAPPMPPAP